MKNTTQTYYQPQINNQGYGSQSDDDDCDFSDTDECVVSRPHNQQHFKSDNLTQQNANIGQNTQIPPKHSNTQIMNNHQQQNIEKRNILGQTFDKQRSPLFQNQITQKQFQQSMVVPSTSNKENEGNRQLNKQRSRSGLYHSKSVANLNGTLKKQQNQYQTAQSQVDPNDPEYETDFNKAYMKLVHKYSQHGNNLLVTQDEIAKLQHTQQNISLQNFNQRTQQILENKQQRTRMLQEMKEQAEMEECTFKPQTYSQKEKRNFEQFLKDQAIFEEQRRKRKQERLEQTQILQQSKMKHQPRVNKKSAKIVEQKRKLKNYESGSLCQGDQETPVYERLHNIHHEKMQKKVMKAMEMTTTLTRTKSSLGLKKTKSEVNFLSATRSRDGGKTIDEVLYEDAKRRWEKQEQKKKELQRMKQEAIQATKPPTGHKNSIYAAQKFEKEFYYMVHIIIGDKDHEQEEDFNLREYDDKKLNYMKLGQLLTDLGYLPQTMAPDSVERELLFDMWNILRGEETNGISVINIKKMLLAVHGINLDHLNPSSHQSSIQQPIETIDERHSLITLNNYDENGVLQLTQSEVSKISMKFKPLYVNRVHHMGQFKRVRQNYEDQCTFKPQISKTTEQLAQQRRQRMLSEVRNYQSNGEFDNDVVEGQMMSSQSKQDSDIVSILLHPVNTDKQWKDNAKLLKEEKELEECTFKPKINKYEGNRSQSRLTKSVDKFTELYMKAKPRREKRDKTREDFDFEKGKEECTFQPNIEVSQKTLDMLYQTSRIGESQFFSPISGDSEITQHIPGYQVAMQRMKKGREDRERVKAMLTRGIPGTITDESLLQPLSFYNNQNPKGVFSSFANTSITQGSSQRQNTNNKTMHNSKSSGQLFSMRNQSSQSTTRRKKLKSNAHRRFEKENINSNTEQLGVHDDNNSLYNQHIDNKTFNERGKIIMGSNSRYSDQIAHSHQTQDFNYENEMMKRSQTSQGMHHHSPDYQQDSINTQSMNSQSMKQPLLYVDVNLGPGKSERIIVYDGDTAEGLAEKFAQTHGLDMNMRGKLAQLLEGQISGLLEKIDEEQNSIHSDNL